MISSKPVYFSIIIPTYNRAWCIERSIKSVLNQDYQEWEMIIVDDGSTDNTKQIVEKYLKDSRIKYFYKENGGVNSARNYGIKYISSNMVMFLDSDDELITRVFCLISSVVSKYRDVKIFSFRAVDKSGQQVSYTNKVHGDQMIDFAKFISQKYVHGEVFFVFSRDIFYENVFDEEVNGGEAYLLFKLIKENGLMMINTNARIYHTESPDSLSSSKLTCEKVSNIYKIQTRLIGKYKNDLKKYNKKYLGTAYLVLARVSALSGKKILSLKYFLLGCFYNSLDIKRMLLYWISLFDYNLKINNVLDSFYSKHLL